MKKILSLILLSVVVAFGSISSHALAQDVDMVVEVVVSCPTQVKAGTALFATVTPYNFNCNNSITLTSVMTGLAGNSGGTLGGVGLWGPYRKTFSPWEVPAATCDEYGNVISPGEGSPRALKIIDPVPSSLTGTMATTFVKFLDGSQPVGEEGGCFVQVVP